MNSTLDQKDRGYLPIENYGIIGNLHTAALVALDGSMDFMCYPRFDSPSMFCRMLDKEKGGFFSVFPQMENLVTKQLYLPDTNILVTRFFADQGIIELIDYMPVGDNDNSFTLIRKIIAIRGNIDVQVKLAPRFNYASGNHKIEKGEKHIRILPELQDQPPLYICSDKELKIDGDDMVALINLREDEHASFVLTTNNSLPGTTELDEFVNDSYYSTINFWQEWVSQTNYKGLWQEEVRRSILTLKLLICHEYGSMVAAPTFSLPEAIGHERNWDYRFTWIRDAAFAMHAFLQLGFHYEAKRFLDWTMKQSTEKELQLMFAVDGSTDIDEYNLEHLEGYMNSCPVRIGNDAHKQDQMDIYGELLETVYLYISHRGELTFENWQIIQQYVEYVISNWKAADHSIWEVRGQKRDFLFTRLMCWVAIDRAIKIANHFSFPFDILKWHGVRDEIYYDIHNNFWNDEMQAFVQYKGGTDLDASALLMPILRIISPESEKWKKTMTAIDNELRSDVLVYRYKEQNIDVDGLKGKEGTFTMCSFWHVECMALMGDVTQAKEHFEKMLGYANHLGLFAEQIGMRGEHLGNFPQAFTHLALISAAVQLDYSSKSEKKNPPVY